MDILIIGNGHMGQFLFGSLRGASLFKGRMADLCVQDVAQFDMVINAAGKTDLRFCEDNPLAAWESNVEGPLHVFRLANAVGASYIHISSGCLWDGPYDNEGKAFTPKSPVSPASFYSWTKAACDAMLVSESYDAKRGAARLVILRPRQIYSHINSPRNTLVKLMTYEKLIDTPNSMTSALTISRTIEAISPYMRWLDKSLTMNVYDIGITSPYKVGMILHEAGLRAIPVAMTKSELDSWHKPKRVDAVIEDGFFESLVRPPSVEEELRRNAQLLAEELGRGN